MSPALLINYNQLYHISYQFECRTRKQQNIESNTLAKK